MSEQPPPIPFSEHPVEQRRLLCHDSRSLLIFSYFGLIEKQSWHPEGVVLRVQWSAWAYGVLALPDTVLGRYGGARPPTRWWRGGGKWALNALGRDYRAS